MEFVLPTLAERTIFSDILLASGILLISMWMFSRIRKRKLADAMRPTAQEQIEYNRRQRGVRGDLEDLMVEIEQLAKRLGAHLDAKSFHIERLMREADAKIKRLERLLNNSDAGGNGGIRPPGESDPDSIRRAELDAPTPRTNPRTPSQTNPRMTRLDANRGQPNGEARLDNDRQTSSLTPQPADPTGEAPNNDPLVRSVYELADQGLTSTDIARKLEEHLGKVELILALREA